MISKEGSQKEVRINGCGGMSKREKEIKENTRWGLYNFLTKGSLQRQESQIRGCFLGRRKGPRGARAQPVSQGDITNRLLTLNYFSYQ